jgi:lysophospholipid acyltransferase (LPLAT)-like uncharacterized protein
LAQRSGCPVVPVGVACRPCKRLPTWDSHLIPFPFSKAVIVFGDPIVSREGEVEEDVSRRIEEGINAADKRAEEILS